MSAIAIHRQVGFTALTRENPMTERVGTGLMELLSAAFLPTLTYHSFPQSVGALFDRATAAQEDLDHDAFNAMNLALEPAATFLFNRPDDVPAPEIDIWPDGQIAFEWYVERGRKVTVLINASGRLVFSAVRGEEHDGATAYISGQWPVALVSAVQRTIR